MADSQKDSYNRVTWVKISKEMRAYGIDDETTWSI